MLGLVGNSGHWSKEHSYLLQLHLYFYLENNHINSNVFLSHWIFCDKILESDAKYFV